jgi:hypothetical protein
VIEYIPVSKVENACIDKREEVAQRTEAYVSCEYIIVVSIEELCQRCSTRLQASIVPKIA